jgi:maleate cis-trans isomerase
VLFLGLEPQSLLIQLQGLNSLKNQNGFATIFSLFMSLLLFSFCATFVIVASVLSVKHKANHAAEEAALITASTMDCIRAIEIAEANEADILTCNINSDYVYIETFSRFNNAQVSLFKQLGISDNGVIGKAKAK